MTEQQGPIEGQKPEPTIDLSKAREAADQAAEGAATTINNNFGTEIKSGHVRGFSGVVGGVLLTAGVAYFAGKAGVKAGMKGYILAGQSLVDAAGNYADIAANNAHITAENAAKSHEVLMLVGETVNKFEKAAKNLKK